MNIEHPPCVTASSHKDLSLCSKPGTKDPKQVPRSDDQHLPRRADRRNKNRYSQNGITILERAISPRTRKRNSKLLKRIGAGSSGGLTRSHEVWGRSRSGTRTTTDASRRRGAMRGGRTEEETRVCECRGEARPQLLKYPVPRAHRIRSTPPPSKNNRDALKRLKKNTGVELDECNYRVKAGQKPEQMSWTSAHGRHPMRRACPPNFH